MFKEQLIWINSESSSHCVLPYSPLFPKWATRSQPGMNSVPLCAGVHTKCVPEEGAWVWWYWWSGSVAADSRREASSAAAPSRVCQKDQAENSSKTGTNFETWAGRKTKVSAKKEPQCPTGQKKRLTHVRGCFSRHMGRQAPLPLWNVPLVPQEGSEMLQSENDISFRLKTRKTTGSRWKQRFHRGCQNSRIDLILLNWVSARCLKWVASCCASLGGFLCDFSTFVSLGENSKSAQITKWQ